MISSFHRASVWISVLLVLTLIPAVHGQAAAPGPHDAVLLIVSGTVEVEAKGATAWNAAKPNQTLHLGDHVRSGKASRATLRLSDKSVLRLYELTTLEIKPPAQADHNDVIDVTAGATYFFNRDRPQETQFQTPSASGAIRGTEFNLVVTEDGRTELTLLDGEVDLSNDQGAVQLKSGEQGTVDPGKAPQKTAVINAVNIIQWTLYYPAILDADELEMPEDASRALSSSLSAYRAGDLLQALAQYPGDRTPGSEGERVYRAALLLGVGEVAGAQALLNESVTAPRPAALANALREMIASVKGESFTRSAPRTLASEWLAGSYEAQSRRDLPEALNLARQAVAKAPNSGFAQERLAEMEFSFGHTDQALAALNKSLALAPRNAQALALKGFVVSARNKITEARGYFDQAIALDGSLANGWLGRGLTEIKTGDVNGGRKDLETAAALEPTRAFLRSYLGKAWSLDEPFQYSWNPRLATNELGLAMKLDPKDPTAWLYAALLNDQRNRINQALADLEHSQDLNDNRAVFRSKFLLDQDQAVRSANLALIYQDAGFTDVAVREATKAVDNDYANYSAHLFLSESYDALLDPRKSNLRYEAAWEDELLLADLLAPVGAGVLSQNISQQEYSRMFEADRLGSSSDTEYSSRGSWLESVSQYGTMGNLAYSLDGYYFTDPGFRANNDFENSDFSATVKYQITPKDTAFLEVERTELHSGDVNQYYYETNAGATLRQQAVEDPNILLGFHHEWGPGNNTLFLYRQLQQTYNLNDPNFPITFNHITGGTVIPQNLFFAVGYQDTTELNSMELQHIFQTDSQRLILGARYQTENDQVTNSLARALTPLPAQASLDSDFRRITLYSYYQLKLFDTLRVTLGGTYDLLHYPVNIANPPVSTQEENRERFSPKVGLDWSPWPRTRFRAAYARSVSGLFNNSSTLIEPSEVAGFNEAFRSLIPEATAPASTYETWSVGADHAFPTRTYAAIEADLRNSESDQQIGGVSGNLVFPLPTAISATKQTIDFKEKDVVLNVNQLIGDDFSVGLNYQLTSADIDYNNQLLGVSPTLPNAQSKINNEATLHHLTIFGNWYLPCGFFSQAQANWYSQADKGFIVNEPGADFWQFDLYAGYRFPRRHMEVRIGVLNIANQDYHLDPLTYYIDSAHSRTFEASFKFNF